jgi:hypothetical protein
MACLDWLFPGLPPPGTQRLLPPLHTLRSILSPENNNIQISTHAYTSHKHSTTQYHTIKEYQKQTCLEIKTRFYRFLISKLTLLETRVFQIKQSPHHSTSIKHAGVHMDQVTHSVHLQIDNNLMNPTKLDSP